MRPKFNSIILDDSAIIKLDEKQRRSLDHLIKGMLDRITKNNGLVSVTHINKKIKVS